MNDTKETPAEAPAQGLLHDRRGLAVALAMSAGALVLTALPYMTGGSFDQRVRAYLLSHPELLQEMSTALQARQEGATAEAITQRAQASPALLAVDDRDPAFGPADARVTVIEFFDFRCPGCKATAPEVLRLMQTHPDVRFVFKDWPILDRGDDDVSHYAARAAQAAHLQGRYLPVFRALMAEPALDKAAIDRVLAENGVVLAEARPAMASPEVARRLTDTHAAAGALGLVGTPTFFVNGRASPTIEPAELDHAIRQAKAQS